MSIVTRMAPFQANSDIILALTEPESTAMFIQVDSSDWPAGKLEVQVKPSSSLASVIMTSPIRTSGRESPLPINGGRHAGDSPPKLGTICALTPQTALSPTSESYHHDDDGDDDDDAASLQKSKAQSGCSASLNVTRKDREVNQLLVSPSPSPVPAVKRIMICREKTGTDWQSVFDVVKYGEEKQAVIVMKEMWAKTGDMMRPLP
ncbi:hypothetical protein BD769DRAFT_1382917 [Suillus cothurnatus]|nr:hypothetical protein BD769DRAFT_1382917 [Suillus cothurnatus]